MNFRPYGNTGIKIVANKKQYLSQVSNSCYSFIPLCFCHSQVCEEQKEIKVIVIIFHKISYSSPLLSSSQKFVL
jgi:hypothetical protein